MAESRNNNLLANIALIAGLLSIATDILIIFEIMQFESVSFALEIIAVGTGLVALVLGQDKRKAKAGIILGGIGLGFRLLFMLF